MPNLKDFSKDTIVYGLGTSLQKVFAVILIPFYTRVLTPADYGVLELIGTITFLVGTFAGLGLTGATARYFFIAEDPNEKGRVLYTSMVIRLIANGSITILVIPFAWKISEFLFQTTEYTWAIVLALLSIPIFALSELQEMIYRYYRKTIRYVIILLLRSIIVPVTGILFVVIIKLGVTGVYLASLISAFLIFVTAYYTFSKTKFVRKFSWSWAVKMFKFGYPLIFSGIAVWVLAICDRYIILYFGNTTDVGLYSIGFKFAQIILLINTAINLSSVILIMESYDSEKDTNKPKTKNFLTNMWYIYLIICVPIATFTSIFSVDIVRLLTTPDYLLGALVIPFITFSLVFDQSKSITGNGMTLKENTKPVAVITLIITLLNVILNIALVPILNFVGAAIATCISSLVYLILMYIYSQKYFFIRRNLLPVYLYIFASFSISTIAPFAELKFNYVIPIYIKILTFLLSLFFPFLFGLITPSTALQYAKSIKQIILPYLVLLKLKQKS